jgi:hypothetical protein
MLGPTKGVGMDYRLYRADEHGGPLALLGRHPGYEVAMAARDEDALGQLADAGGQRVIARHLIVGPGVLGPLTAHPVTTAFGSDDLVHVDADATVSFARTWLAGIRKR